MEAGAARSERHQKVEVNGGKVCDQDTGVSRCRLGGCSLHSVFILYV